MQPPILETRPCLFQRKKDLTFDDLAGPVKKIAIPQHARPPKQINKITQLRTQNIKTAYTSRLQQRQRSYTFYQVSDKQRYLLASQLFLDLIRPNNCVIPLLISTSDPRLLPVTMPPSHWHTEFVKKRVTFFLVTVLENTLTEEQSPHVRGSRTVLDSGFYALDSGFQVLDSGLCW